MLLGGNEKSDGTRQYIQLQNISLLLCPRLNMIVIIENGKKKKRGKKCQNENYPNIARKLYVIISVKKTRIL